MDHAQEGVGQKDEQQAQHDQGHAQAKGRVADHLALVLGAVRLEQQHHALDQGRGADEADEDVDGVGGEDQQHHADGDAQHRVHDIVGLDLPKACENLFEHGDLLASTCRAEVCAPAWVTL